MFALFLRRSVSYEKKLIWINRRFSNFSGDDIILNISAVNENQLFQLQVTIAVSIMNWLLIPRGT